VVDSTALCLDSEGERKKAGPLALPRSLESQADDFSKRTLAPSARVESVDKVVHLVPLGRHPCWVEGVRVVSV